MMKRTILLSALVVLIFLVGGAISQSNENVTDINPTYSKYGDGGGNFFTAHDGLTYQFKDNGRVDIWSQGAELIGGYELAISGSTTDTNQEDYDWIWELTNVTVIEGGYRYTKYIMKGSNNDETMPWIQEYEFTPHKDVKIRANITNNDQSISNFNFWFVSAIEGADEVRFNNVIYSPNLEQTITLDENSDLGNADSLGDVLPRISFLGAHTFGYEDLLNAGYNVTEVVIGDGERFGWEGKKVFALGVTKNENTLSSGETWELDPSSTGWLYPNQTGTMGFNNWTNPENCFSDADIATETTAGHAQDYSNFYIPVKANWENCTINVRVNARAANHILPPPPKWDAKLYTELTWFGGVSSSYWTNTGNSNKWSSSSYLTKEFTDSTDDWGHDWCSGGDVEDLGDGNFGVRFNCTDCALGGDFNPGVNYAQVIVYYDTNETVNLTFIDPTPADSATIGSTFTVNVSSSHVMTSANLSSNHTGTWENYTMTLENNTIASVTLNGEFDGLNNGTNFEYQVFAVTLLENTNTSTRTATVESDSPEVTLNSPANGSASPENYRLLNFTITDGESDIFDYWIIQGNTGNEKNYFEHIVNQTNGTFTYNWDTPVADLDKYAGDGLYAYYKLDNLDKFGEFWTGWVGEEYSNMSDFSGNGFDGFETVDVGNDVEPSDGKIMGGFTFDGADDSIQIGMASDDDFEDVCDNGCSFFLWADSADESLSYALTRYSVGDSEKRSFLIQHTIGFNFALYNIINDSNGASMSCAAPYSGDTPENVWLHVGMTWNKTDICSYINASLIGCNPCKGSVNATTWTISEPVFIGDAGGYAWNGELDEVIIFNRSLNSTEVANIAGLETGTWYWNVSAYDSPNGVGSDMAEFSVDSCSYGSGNWEISCSDDCVISSDVVGDSGANFTLLGGEGTFIIQGANITGFYDYTFEQDSGGAVCEASVVGGGRLG